MSRVWKQPRWLALFVLSLAFLSMVGPSRQAQFVMSDDWDVLQACVGDGRAGLWEMTLPLQKYQLSPGVARFFPGTWILKGLEIGLFGPHPPGYHLLRMALGLATLVLVYFASQPWLGPLLACWVSLAFVSGPQAITWMRLGYSEAWSMLLVAAGLYCLSRAAQLGRSACPPRALLCLSLVGWIKETFIPVVPMLHLLLLLARSSWARPTRAWGGAWLACCLQVTGLAWEVCHDPPVYGGQSADGFWRGLGRWLVNYRLAGLDEWLLLAAGLACWTLAGTHRRLLLRWLPVLAALVVGQLLISAAMFGDLVPDIQVHDGQGRYLFPGLLGPLGCMAAALTALRQAWQSHPTRRAWLTLATAMAALAFLHRALPQVRFQREVARHYTLASQKFERALQEVDLWRDQHPDSPCILLGSALDEEGFLSLATFLHFRRPRAELPWMQVGPARGQASWAPLRVRKQKEEWLEGFTRRGWSWPAGVPGIQAWPPPRPRSECLLLVLPRAAPSDEQLQGWLHVIQLPDGY